MAMDINQMEAVSVFACYFLEVADSHLMRTVFSILVLT